uniref:RING-type domain-containing protein n=1 Tax=Chromera velia CCMP2878 TaxID=1169474 RepID=A0A0G4HII8_9ALVE|mmetsp:Transcript_5827/g.11563  ORF Transcript_5827/g.11563 Transcript_5827/m.11563 type:complete len:82 (+) Transcript_5827:231-476(+)|eukprot:Cvel_6957.t1-p1 / transcript=Cvel_6957.t1 / gene=Cvel_6957 / organism=Chromera_velia_CCMP2878 / gene_product=hypothetical protein / transcript_product=hypothetical protein / location=Cvel_scaffold352:89339-91239(+) / protein_length=81 / sequence_SO=supercontig / SO=protein_coding / is_pseudo=false
MSALPEREALHDPGRAPTSAPDRQCLNCAAHNRQGKVSYMGVPCGCPTLCRECAMKMATGGKCRACGELFTSLRRTLGSSH